MEALQKPTRRQNSGAKNRKIAQAKKEREHAARIELLRAQGKYNENAVSKAGVVWKPRPHQKEFELGHMVGLRRQAHVWHRRAGKTSGLLDFMARRAMERPGGYWFLTPKLTQARTAIWENRRADGLRELDVHFPADVRVGENQNHMTIELLNGSLIKFLGSDGYDRMVGANVAGIVFDEFSLGDPAAWDYLAPILAPDPESWALFISTYRGRNHWYRMVQRNKDNPDWHTSVLTVEDTFREDGKTRIVTPEMIDRERKEGKSEEYLQQEYFCNPMAAFDGAYYAGAMRLMQHDGRICHVAYDSSLPVTAAVDLGFADELVFTFWQNKGNEERCIGSRSWQFVNLSDALDDVKISFPWGRRPMTAVLPHDGRFGTGELFERYGYDPVLLPRTRSVTQEIEMVRGFLGRVSIDNAARPWTDNDDNNARLVDALLGYRTAKSKTEAGVYEKAPAHSWESHWADSVRYYVVYRQDNEATSTWGPAPNYEQADKIARTVV
ncbi:MAG: terminase family protein [Woeseia sp.]